MRSTSRRRIDISVEPDREILRRKFKLDPKEIYYLSSIFQCYDEVGEIRTVDPEKGIVALYTTSSCLPICMEILEGVVKEGVAIESVDD